MDVSNSVYIRLFYLVFCVAVGFPAFGEIIIRPSSIVTIGKSLVDIKESLRGGGQPQNWIISDKNQLQVHYLKNGEVQFSTIYFYRTRDLVRADFKIVEGKIGTANLLRIVNPEMHFSEGTALDDDTSTCSESSFMTNLQELIKVGNAPGGVRDGTVGRSCSVLKSDEAKYISKNMTETAGEKTQSCVIRAAERFKVNSENFESMRAVSAKLFEREAFPVNSSMFTCTSRRTDDRTSSSASPEQININLIPRETLVTRFSQDVAVHEFIHITLQKSCLAERKLYCERLSGNEDLVQEMQKFVADCRNSKIEDSVSSLPTAVMAAAQPQVIAQAVAPTQGVKVSAIDMPNIKLPTQTRQLQDLAYSSAAREYARSRPEEFKVRTTAMASAMLNFGNNLRREFSKRVDFDLIPIADASTSEPPPKLRLSNPTLTQASVGTNQGLDGAQNSLRPARHGRAIGEANERTESVALGQQRGPSGRLDVASSRGSSAGSGSSSPSGGSSGDGRGSRGASGGMGAGDGGGLSRETSSGGSSGDRAPAAIGRQTVTADQVVASLKADSGREILAKLTEGQGDGKSPYEQVLVSQKIAIIDFQDKIYGVQPEKASSCYVIRDLQRRLTPVNCAQRRRSR